MSKPKEEAYMPNVRAADAVRREQGLWEQLRWHTAQARRHRTVMGVLVGHHEQEAARIAKELGVDYEGDDAV